MVFSLLAVEDMGICWMQQELISQNSVVSVSHCISKRWIESILYFLYEFHMLAICSCSNQMVIGHVSPASDYICVPFACYYDAHRLHIKQIEYSCVSICTTWKLVYQLFDASSHNMCATKIFRSTWVLSRSDGRHDNLTNEWFKQNLFCSSERYSFK